MIVILFGVVVVTFDHSSVTLKISNFEFENLV